ncbi:MAG: hypothetical protein CM1200mP18_12270 [Gammaproteobacteria bacterium]|nr:MAG: hypothetical protein CM1200mP18_12270 [Gammaproteobacteria bacterium]
MADSGVDFLFLEMMLDIEHASRALEAAVGTVTGLGRYQL